MSLLAVQVNTLRYHGQALMPYRNRHSPFGGVHAGKWPIAVDPGDIRRVYFQDPAEHRWHPLEREHAADLNRPLSSDRNRRGRQGDHDIQDRQP